jgi:hypothetical protein
MRELIYQIFVRIFNLKKNSNDKGVPLIIEDLNRKGIDLSKNSSYIQV